MITIGVDVGAKNAKLLVLRDGEIVGKKSRESGFDQETVTNELLAATLAEFGIDRDEVTGICSTGAGRKAVQYAGDKITEVTAAARACFELYPDTKTVIDVGAEEGRAIRSGERGKVEDFAINEKCAAGSGAFTEAMARALEVSVDELGRISLKSDASVPMNAQCAVFAESEVISLLHARTPKQDIAKAIHDAIASRIVSMTRRVGLNKPVVLVGGMARNVGFIHSLNTAMQDEVRIPDAPEMIAAYGAALVAAERAVVAATETGASGPG
ncbi:MAG: 2-hydroxyisocaproyl-CoA dehydratase activator [Calditrichaeota bacterium]|nr:2-hydroxyisocaproyl-CoA dehydratase activator [Calditrichota bacterium]